MKNSWAMRLGISCMFLAYAMAYNLLIVPEDNWPMYYASAALFDALIVLSLKLFGNNQLVFDLQDINYAAIVLHAVGFLMYMAYLPPDEYNIRLYALIIIQWLRLLWVGPDDERNTLHSFRFRMVRHCYSRCG